MAPRQNFRALRLIYDEGFVAAGLDAVVDLDVPVLERRADGFNFALDALLDGREDDPGFRRRERARRSGLPYEIALLSSSGIYSRTNLASVLR